MFKIGDIVILESGIGLKPRLGKVTRLFDDSSLVQIKTQHNTTNTLSWKLALASKEQAVLWILENA
jgi:hypothetical protein